MRIEHELRSEVEHARERIAELEAELEQFRWVSVEERLPKDGQYVLAFGSPASEDDFDPFSGDLHDGCCLEAAICCLAEYYQEPWSTAGGLQSWIRGTDGEYNTWLNDVTHWMPLPSPPEDI